MSEVLVLTEKAEGDAVRLFLTGEIDIYSAPDFKKRFYKIVEERKKDIIIDCEGLTYIDSTGLGILVGALKRARQNEKEVKIVNLKDNIKKLFIITNLDKVFLLEE